jgi:hypothetical protein
MGQRARLKPPLLKGPHYLNIQNWLAGRTLNHNFFDTSGFDVHTQYKYPLGWWEEGRSIIAARCSDELTLGQGGVFRPANKLATLRPARL